MNYHEYEYHRPAAMTARTTNDTEAHGGLDPISLGALVALITQSAAGEAGKSAWEGLGTLARRAFRHEQRAEAALQAVREGLPAAPLDLAGHLIQRAVGDPELMGLLHAWMSETQQITAADGPLSTRSAARRACATPRRPAMSLAVSTSAPDRTPQPVEISAQGTLSLSRQHLSPLGGGYGIR